MTTDNGQRLQRLTGHVSSKYPTATVFEKDLSSLESQLSALQERLRETEAERDGLHKMFEELTPGGSEFYRSPLRCFEFVRDRLATTVAIAKERNDLRAEKSRADTAESKLTTANARNLDLQAQVVARIQERDTAERALEAHLHRTVSEPTEWNLGGLVTHGATIPVSHPIAAPCQLCEALASARQPAAGQDNEVTPDAES